MKNIFSVLILLSSFASFAGTSEEERANKQYELTLQVGADYRMSPTQIAAMYFIDSRNLVGLKMGVDRQGEERQTNIALQYKYYTSNSFYVAGEAFYLNTREDVNGFWGEVFDLHDYAEYSSLGAGIRIGNQWTWKYFTLGCDWIGIGQRVGTFKKETSALNETTFTLFNVIIGASF